MNLKESTLNKADVKTALNNALKNDEEFDIPFKYSDEWEFTDELDNYLDKQGYEFVDSFRDKKYGSLYEYSDGFESIYLMMDTSLSSRPIVTGIISDKVYNESKKSARKSIKESFDSWENEYIDLDKLTFGINTKDGFDEFKFIKNVDVRRKNDIVIVFGQIDTKEWACVWINNSSLKNGILAGNLISKNKKEVKYFFDNVCRYQNITESKKSTKKSVKESKVDYQSVINSIIPKEYAHNKNAYKYALSCVTSLYNEDEYDSDNAKVYFLNCYLSDLFPWWVDELGEEEMDALANGLYDGLMKWKDIDSSWFEE